MLPFFFHADKNKSVFAASLSLSLSQHFPFDPTPTPTISVSCSPRRGGEGGVGGGQDVFVVMVTDGCACFTKTSCCHTSAAEHLQKNNSKHQDGRTWEYDKITSSKQSNRCLSRSRAWVFQMALWRTKRLIGWYNRKTGLYLNVEGSGAGDDLKQVVSQQEIPDGHTQRKVNVLDYTVAEGRALHSNVYCTICNSLFYNICINKVTSHS